MKTMITVRHPNLVELYAAGITDGYCWAAMEFVDGESLTKVIERIGIAGMLDWHETFRVAVHVARALAVAAEHKIIHRNVTPQNILRRSSDKVTKLGDLMLAKALEGALAQQVTQPGELLGELPYMSPERTLGDPDAPVDCRSDIYELGATLYALLTGRPPFEGPSLPKLVKDIREVRPKSPRSYHMAIPEAFEDVVLKMLAKRPGDRYATPGRLLADLESAGRYHRIDPATL